MILIILCISPIALFAQQDEKLADIFIKSNPEGASVYIDGIKLGITPLLTFYPQGNYKIKLKCDDYEEIDDTINIKIPLTEKTYNLKDISATLTINTIDKAKVYLNNELISDIKNIKLSQKPYSIKVELGKTSTMEEKIIPKKNEKIVLNMFPEIITGSFQIAVFPSDAQIYLTDEQLIEHSAVGSTIFENIPAGVCEYKVTKKGFITYSNEVLIEKNDIVKKSISLDTISTASIFKPIGANEINDRTLWGEMTIKVIQKDTDIFVNGKFVGKGEAKVIAYAGNHEIKLEKINAMNETFIVPVETDLDTYIEAILIEGIGNEYNEYLSLKKEYKTWEDFYDRSKEMVNRYSFNRGEYHICAHSFDCVFTYGLNIAAGSSLLLDLMRSASTGFDSRSYELVALSRRRNTTNYAYKTGKKYFCTHIALLDTDLYTDAIPVPSSEMSVYNAELKNSAQEKADVYNSDIFDKEQPVISKINNEIKKAYIKYRIGNSKYITIPSSIKF